MTALRNNFKQITFDVLAAAAFITPGSIIACAVSGVTFGYAMLWALVLAVLITIVMQEMYLRLGVVTGKGLAENLKRMITNKFVYAIVISVVFILTLGSAVMYITGNISAIQLGFLHLFPKVPPFYFFIGCGVLLLLIVSIGLHDKVELAIISILLLLSAMFLLSAFVSKPNPVYLLKGLFVPTLRGEESAWRCIVALIASTVLPYQLFLSASSSRERWAKSSDLTSARMNLVWTIVLSGLVSASIVVCAAAVQFKNSNTEALSLQNISNIVEALVGDSSSTIFCAALCFSGLASVLLIALNLTHFFEGVLEKHPIQQKIYYLLVTYFAIIAGVLISFMGSKNPISAILMMQNVNALLLPICALVLLYVMNHRCLGQHRNSPFENMLLLIILALTSVLAYHAVLLILTRFENIIVRITNVFNL